MKPSELKKIIGEEVNQLVDQMTEGKGQDLADKYVAKLRSEFRKLNDDELDEFRETIAQALDLKESVNEGFTKKDWDVKWKMPKDNLFNATKTKNAVDNRYKALQNLLKDKPKELKAFDATDDHSAYDMSYDELMKWYNNLSESVNEGSSIINNIQFDNSFFDADHEWMVKNKIKLSQVINKAIADSMIIQNADEEGKTITLSLR